MEKLNKAIEALNGLCFLTKSYYSIRYEYRDKIYIVRMMNKHFRNKDLSIAIEKCILYVSNAENINLFPETVEQVENLEKKLLHE